MFFVILLCVEWLDCLVNKVGVDKDLVVNFVVIGIFDFDIEIWDLDIIDCMYLNVILGQGVNFEEEIKKKKKKKLKKVNDEYYVDVVLVFVVNRKYCNFFVLGLVDKIIKFWDFYIVKCVQLYSYYIDKVCLFVWYGVEFMVLLSGSYDCIVVIVDMCVFGEQLMRVGVESDIEIVRWDFYDFNFFYVLIENGIVYYFDVCKVIKDFFVSSFVWKFQVYDEFVLFFDLNLVILGFMVIGLIDKIVKIWDIIVVGLLFVVFCDFDVGKVFLMVFVFDCEVVFRVFIVGSNGNVFVWDISINVGVCKVFV